MKTTLKRLLLAACTLALLSSCGGARQSASSAETGAPAASSAETGAPAASSADTASSVLTDLDEAFFQELEAADAAFFQELEDADTAKVLELLATSDGAYTEGAFAKLGELFFDAPEEVLQELLLYSQQYAASPEGKKDPQEVLFGLGYELDYLPDSPQKEQLYALLENISEDSDMYEIACGIKAGCIAARN